MAEVKDNNVFNEALDVANAMNTSYNCQLQHGHPMCSGQWSALTANGIVTYHCECDCHHEVQVHQEVKVPLVVEAIPEPAPAWAQTPELTPIAVPEILPEVPLVPMHLDVEYNVMMNAFMDALEQLWLAQPNMHPLLSIQTALAMMPVEDIENLEVLNMARTNTTDFFMRINATRLELQHAMAHPTPNLDPPDLGPHDAFED